MMLSRDSRRAALFINLNQHESGVKAIKPAAILEICCAEIFKANTSHCFMPGSSFQRGSFGSLISCGNYPF